MKALAEGMELPAYRTPDGLMAPTGAMRREELMQIGIHDTPASDRAKKRTTSAKRLRAGRRDGYLDLASATFLDEPTLRALAEVLSTPEAPVPPSNFNREQLVAALGALLGTSGVAGLVQVRCRALQALSKLGAADSIADFLIVASARADGDTSPGERAVLNTAAKALRGSPEAGAVQALLRCALRWRLPGAIEALASIPRPSVIPGLVAGLYDDRSRAVAAAALQRWNGQASPILWRTVIQAPRKASASRLRARRAAARILAQISLTHEATLEVRRWLDDPDVEISGSACVAILHQGEPDSAAAAHARRRLAEIEGRLSLPLRHQACAVTATPELRTPSFH